MISFGESLFKLKVDGHDDHSCYSPASRFVSTCDFWLEAHISSQDTSRTFLMWHGDQQSFLQTHNKQYDYHPCYAPRD